MDVIDPIDWYLQKTEAQTYLQEVAARLEELAPHPMRFEVLEGHAAACIVNYADRQSIDLVVLSSHGEGGLSAWNTSSVAQKVIQRAGCSIFLSRAYTGTEGEHTSFDVAHYRRIMVLLDGSQRAEAILPLASALVRQHEAELVLVHVVRPPEILERTPRTQEDHLLVAQLSERNYSVATRYFDELQASLSPEPYTYILQEADIASALHQFAVQHEIDLVLATAHGYSGRTQWPYGAIASSFIQYGVTPLLILQDAPKRDREISLAERMCVPHPATDFYSRTTE